MVKDKTQVCKFVKQKPNSSQLSTCKTHSPITAHGNCQRGEELEKLDCLDWIVCSVLCCPGGVLYSVASEW